MIFVASIQTSPPRRIHTMGIVQFCNFHPIVPPPPKEQVRVWSRKRDSISSNVRWSSPAGWPRRCFERLGCGTTRGYGEPAHLSIPLVPASPRHPKRCLGHPANYFSPGSLMSCSMPYGMILGQSFLNSTQPGILFLGSGITILTILNRCTSVPVFTVTS